MRTPLFDSRAWLRPLATFALLAHPLFAQSLPAEAIKLDSLAAFRAVGANWKIAADVAGDPRRDKTLATVDGTGILVCTPGTTKETRTHLLTAWDHGDLELDLEFLLTPRSNSGVYLQGRYEVQLFDSWGVKTPSPADCGGIYSRWDSTRGTGKELFEGTAPRANASRAPGLWQKLHVEFQAPRFDATGKKTRNARLTKVVLNGYTIHENVEVTGPTRSSIANDEVPLGPLMIQGDHGAVAIRALAVKRFETGATLAVDNLRYRLHPGSHTVVGAYDSETPSSEGVLARFTHSAVEKSGRFALVFTGAFKAPRDGMYRFATESSGPVRLLIDGRPVVTPVDRAGQPGTVALTAGTHEFRLDWIHATPQRPTLELLAEGPGLAPHTLTVREATGPGRGGRGGGALAGRQLVIEPQERILLQRGFVPFEPRKRLYAAAVGTPAGVHYAYDFETGTVLRAWRGPFADAFQMRETRGTDQTIKPVGPALTFNGKPTVALIEYAANGDWPDQPDALWSSQGYTLEADGQPVFLSSLANLSIRDRIAPAKEGRGLVRTLNLKGSLPSWSAWVLLAEAETITPQPSGGWIVGQREWFLDWPADAAQRPVLRTVNGRQQLAVPLSAGLLEKPLSYSIVW